MRWWSFDTAAGGAEQPRDIAAVRPPDIEGTPAAVPPGMPRRYLPALALGALAACLDFDPVEIPPIFTCDAPLFPGSMCVDADHPIDFRDDQMWLAAGGTTPLDYLTVDGLVFTLTSDQPAVLEVVAGADATFTLRAGAVGAANVVARGADGAVLRTLPVEVAPIAAVEFRFDPAGDAALTALAALPGAAERLRVVARDADDRELAGAASVLEFTTTGPIATAALDEAEHRSSGLFTFTRWPGFETAVRFDGLGAATLVASADGVDLATLPIDVIAAATDVELRLAAPELPVRTLQFADLVGTDARGVPVAGLVGDFAASPAALLRAVDPHGPQGMFETLAPGVATITATLPDRTLTASFTIVAP